MWSRRWAGSFAVIWQLLLVNDLGQRSVEAARPSGRPPKVSDVQSNVTSDPHRSRANAIDVDTVVTIEVPVRCAAQVLVRGAESLANMATQMGLYSQVELAGQSSYGGRPAYQNSAGEVLMYVKAERRWMLGGSPEMSLPVARSAPSSSECPSLCPTDACGWEVLGSTNGTTSQWAVHPHLVVEATGNQGERPVLPPAVEQESDSSGTQEPAVSFAYVVFEQDGLPNARAIIDKGAECPPITAGSLTLQARQRFAGSDRFPIQICEADLPTDFAGGQFGSAPLPSLATDFSHTLVLGDTGVDRGPHCQCVYDGDLYGVPPCQQNETHTCGEHGFSSWASDAGTYTHFASLAAVAAANKPELVVHTGGYVHRHTPCASKMPGCPSALGAFAASWGDSWLTWQEDFFTPAKPLLEAAPWITVRGDQEGCVAHWRGWTLFLDPRPLQLEDGKLVCPKPAAAYDIGVGRDQYIIMDDSQVPVEDASFAPGVGGNCSASDPRGIEALLMDRRIDSEQPQTEIDTQVERIAAQLKRVGTLAANSTDRPSILLTHRPIFAVTCRNGNLVQMDWTMQKAFKKARTSLVDVMLVISGHLRFFEVLDFGKASHPEALPAQAVVGNTNRHVAKVGIPKGQLGGVDTKVLGNEIARADVQSHYGFATLSSAGKSLNIRAMQIPASEVPQAFFRLSLRRQ